MYANESHSHTHPPNEVKSETVALPQARLCEAFTYMECQDVPLKNENRYQ